LLLSLIACRGKTPQSQAADSNAQPQREATFAQDSMRDFFIESSVADVPGTENDIIAAFGEPDSVVRLPSANAQDPMKFDTIIEVHYPGLSATILKVDANETLETIGVTDTVHVTGPIRVGTDTATLRRLLGAPVNIGGKPGYVCAKCSILNEAVAFDIFDGRVNAMTFSFPALANGNQ
jgi:hypothetical protein